MLFVNRQVINMISRGRKVYLQPPRRFISDLTGAILTFEDVSALQLLHCWSLTQSPAEKHQNHVLDHFNAVSKVSVTVSAQQRGSRDPRMLRGNPASHLASKHRRGSARLKHFHITRFMIICAWDSLISRNEANGTCSWEHCYYAKASSTKK